MARVLILYSSFDGQARRIAGRIGDVLARAGHLALLRSADAPAAEGEIAASDGVVVGGAIRYGHYAPSLERLVRRNAGVIASRPDAFFSVCLSAGGPGARPATAQGYVGGFLERTGWRPRHSASFAGALPYSRYNPFIRLMMRLIVGVAGGETDASRDYEYTDWPAVERFAGEYAATLAAGHGPARAA